MEIKTKIEVSFIQEIHGRLFTDLSKASGDADEHSGGKSSSMLYWYQSASPSQYGAIAKQHKDKSFRRCSTIYPTNVVAID